MSNEDKKVGDLPQDNQGSAGGDNKGGSGKELSYETYQRTVAEAKKLRQEREEMARKLEAFEAEKRELEEKKLVEKGEIQKVLEAERKRREEAEKKLNEREKTLLDAHKLAAFREKLPGRLASNEYYSFVDVDAIAVDPSTGELDENTLKSVVDSFVAKHGRLLEVDRRKLPSDAPTQSKKLTYEEWLKLPPKERVARMGEAVETYAKQKQ